MGDFMAVEMTFSIIKPNAVKKNAVGSIIKIFEDKGLKITAAKMVCLSRSKCEEFYAEHKARPFFGELVDFMTSGPVVLMCLKGENAADFELEVGSLELEVSKNSFKTLSVKELSLNLKFS